MKLLFDENLSRVLVTRLSDLFPDSSHVVLLGMENTPDAEIFQYASDNDFIIVSKDSDFNELVSASTESPGIIWIRSGNCSTDNVETLIRNNFEQIMEIAKSKSVGLLMLF